MIYWALVFFLIAFIAGVFGFSGLAQDSAFIARVLAVVGIVLAILFFAFGRRTRPG